MNSWLGSIALAICNPFAFVIGGVLGLCAYQKVKEADSKPDEDEDDWPISIYKVLGERADETTVTHLICADSRKEAGEKAREKDSSIVYLLAIDLTESAGAIVELDT